MPRAATPKNQATERPRNGTYYLFGTGPGIAVWSSKDRQYWPREKPVFASAPAWATQAVPGYRDNHIWAPDISFHDGRYYLFCSVSAFGKNISCIGLATNKTLDPVAPDFWWEDHGRVLHSVPGRDLWNAIDPNLIRDEAGRTGSHSARSGAAPSWCWPATASGTAWATTQCTPSTEPTT